MSDTTTINYPALQLAVNGVAVANGPTVRKGDKLTCTVTDPAWFGWQARWNTQGDVVAFGVTWDTKGVGTWTVDLEPGRHEMQIRRPDNELGIDFYVNVIDSSTTATPAAEPAKPAPPLVMPADTQDDLLVAIAAGATTILTTGLTLTAPVDCRNAAILMLAGTPGYKAIVELQGTARLANVSNLDMAVASDDVKLRRKGITCTGSSVGINGVTFGENLNYCVHVQHGECAVQNSRTAKTFDGYGVFLEDGTFIVWTGGYIGSSRRESTFRSAGGRAILIGVELDAMQIRLAKGQLDPDAKYTALRGAYRPYPDGSPGLHAYKGCIFRGLVAPNGLDGMDGGQMIGVDRWPLTDKTTVQVPASLDGGKTPNPTIGALVTLARSMYAIGKSISEIVAATYVQFTGRTMAAADVAACVAERARMVGMTSSALIEDCSIPDGHYRLAARTVCRIVNTPVNAGASAVFAGNSTPYYPDPAMVLDKNEAGAPPSWSIEKSPLSGNGVGVDGKDYPGVVVDGQPLTAAAVKAAA